MSRKSDYSKPKILTKNLNDREIQILFLIANGKTNSEIASIVYLSPNTIKADVSIINKKLGAENRTEAVYIAAKNGIFKDHASLFDCFINKL